jgi:hypothetical protein
MGEILLGDLGGTSIFGNLRDVHPRIYALAVWFWLGGVVAAWRTACLRARLRKGFRGAMYVNFRNQVRGRTSTSLRGPTAL